MTGIVTKYRLALMTVGMGIALASVANAETITWANWTSSTAGAPGSATGTLALGSGVTVTYNGQLGGLENDTNWTPSTTWAGGNVSNAPDSNPQIWMTGGGSYEESVTFSQAVTDPTFAFWSLGGANNTTSTWNFDRGENFTIEACGPSNLGGGCITRSGQTLSGDESSGTIQFAGTYTSISFTTPVYEYWTNFTVGAAGIAPASTVTPEPSSIALLATGLLSVGGAVRRRIRRA